VLIRLIKAFTYTREVYRISRLLGGSSSFSLEEKTTNLAIERMKKLWKSNDLLVPIIKEYGASAEVLTEYYWLLSANGAGQWVRGYYVSVASLCFPIPLRYVLQTMTQRQSIRNTASDLLDYFDHGNPYRPMGAAE
jgi:hypothetical protein